jgi:hypothetical protein
MHTIFFNFAFNETLSRVVSLFIFTLSLSRISAFESVAYASVHHLSLSRISAFESVAYKNASVAKKQHHTI